MSTESNATTRRDAETWSGHLLRVLRDRSGALTVEFALVAPILLGLLFGVMEIGRLMFTQAVLSYAVQETSRWALVNPPVGSPPDYTAYETQLKAQAKNNVIIIDPSGALPITTAAAADAGLRTTTISIQMDYAFSWMLPFVGSDTGSILLSSSSTNFVVENVIP